MKKKPKAYTVYGHCNLTNGKWYVGMTSQNPKKRWHSGWGYKFNTQMWNDIKDSSWNTDWLHTIFDTFNNREDALDYEAFLMGMFDSIDNGYNVSDYDSRHYKHSEEHRKKMSEAMTGKHLSEESKNKISEAMTGKHHRPQKSVIQLSREGELIAEYPSTCEASRQTGCHQGDICKCCKGTRKSVGGYIWKYKKI